MAKDKDHPVQGAADRLSVRVVESPVMARLNSVTPL